MYNELCNELLSIIPNIQWDTEGCNAIKEAVRILSTLQEDNLHHVLCGATVMRCGWRRNCGRS